MHMTQTLVAPQTCAQSSCWALVVQGVGVCDSEESINFLLSFSQDMTAAQTSTETRKSSLSAFN